MTTTLLRRTATAGVAGAVATALLVGVPATASQTAAESLTTAAKVSSGEPRYVRDIVGVGDRSYFLGDTPQHGEELWTSDGTSEGTRLVKDIRPGSATSTNSLKTGSAAVLGDVLYFIADDGTHGGTLWRSDGTPAGTQLVKDVLPAATAYNEMTSLIEIGGALYFLVVTGPGMELWTSDGTSGGTVKVADVGTCQDGICYAGPILALGDGLVMIAGDDSDGELWYSDGTAAGTSRIGPATIRQLTVSGDHAYFTTGEFGYGELWHSDGTSAGTEPLPGAARDGDFVDHYTGLTDVAGELFYMVDYLSESNGERYELRRVDQATEAGTLVKSFDFQDGGALMLDAGSAVAIGDVLYFVPVSFNQRFFPGRALWRSDGTTAGTTKLLDGFVYRLAEVADQLVFARAGETQGQWRVWRSDGTVAGTAAVTGPSFPYPSGDETFVQPGFADIGGEAFFAAKDPNTTQEGLWKVGTDLTAPDTLITGGFANGEVVTSYAGEVKQFTFAVTDDFTPTAGTTFEVQVDGGPWWPTADATYDFMVRDFGWPNEGPHTISVRTVDAAGRVDATPATRSFTIDLAPPEPLQNFGDPTIEGTARLGQQLTAQPAEWSEDPDSVTHQWLRDGSPIPGATGTTYLVTLDDIGRQLRVRERAEKADFEPSTATSAPVTVARVASTSKLTLKSARIRQGQRATAVVKVAADDAVPVGGKVKVLDGRKTVGTATLAKGRATVRLARLSRGTHRLKAVYAGSQMLAPSTSSVVRLVVIR